LGVRTLCNQRNKLELILVQETKQRFPSAGMNHVLEVEGD